MGENIEKYIRFSVPVRKENENGKAIPYKIKFINSVRFMSSSLSSLSDNLAKGLHKDKCKNCKSDLESIMAYWYSNVSTARKMMMKNSKNI